MSCFKKKKRVFLCSRYFDNQEQLAVSRFPEGTYFQIEREFKRITQNKETINRTNFKQIMGILGLDSVDHLVERMFDSLPKNQEDCVDFVHFIDYIGKLFYGTEEEKAEMSYRFIDVANKGSFQVGDLQELIGILIEAQSCPDSDEMSLGNKRDENYKEETLEIAGFLFEIFDVKKKGEVSREDFLEVLEVNPDVMNFFDLINKGFAEKIAISSQNSTIKQHYESLLLIEKELKRTQRKIKSSNGNQKSSQINHSCSNNEHPEKIEDSPRPNARLNSLDSSITPKSHFFKTATPTRLDEKRNVNLNVETPGVHGQHLKIRRTDTRARISLISKNFYEKMRGPSGQKLESEENESEKHEDHSEISPNQVSVVLRPKMTGGEGNTPGNSPGGLDGNEPRLRMSNPSPIGKRTSILLNEPDFQKRAEMVQEKDGNWSQSTKKGSEKEREEEKSIKGTGVILNKKAFVRVAPGKGDQDSLVSQDEERNKPTFEHLRGKKEPEMDKFLKEIDDQMSKLESLASQTKERFFTNIMHRKYNSHMEKSPNCYFERERENQKERLETEEDMRKRMTSYKSFRQKTKKKFPKSQDTIVLLGHAHWDLVLYMITGLQMAAKSLVSPSQFSVHPCDFKTKYYFEILPRFPPSF